MEAALTRQRQVLGHQHDVEPVGRQVGGHREDPAVTVRPAHPGRQDGGVDVVELDPQRALRDRDRVVQPAVLDAQVVQHPQRLTGEPAELGVVPLALELADHDQREHHLVLGEARDRAGVGQQDGGVEHEGRHGSSRRAWLLRPGPGHRGRAPAPSNAAARTGPPERPDGLPAAEPGR
jgi:hypothetical protein